MKIKGITYQQKKLEWTLGIALICFCLVSCRKNFSSDKFIEDDKLVVLAEIVAGDSVKIPVGKTIKVGDGNLIRFEKVTDASVKLIEDNSRTWILQPNWSQQFGANPTTVFTSRRHFRPNTTYAIEIKHPSLGTAVASTHIPQPIKNYSLDTASETFQGKPVLAVTIKWFDPVDPGDYYIIEAVKEILKTRHYFYYRGARYDYDTPGGSAFYNQVQNTQGVVLIRDTISMNKFLRLEVFTQDNNSENISIDNLNNPFRRIFFKDHSFNGNLFSTKIYVDRQFFKATDPNQKGRIRIQLKAASKELFDYLFTYEKYKTDFGSVPANQLTSPVGNVKNGLGIFGGASRKERMFYFDPLH